MIIFRWQLPRCRLASSQVPIFFGSMTSRIGRSTSEPRDLTLSRSAGKFRRKFRPGSSHDWLGAGFVPNAKIEDILRIVRDYDRYKEIYQPGVIDSVSHGSDGVIDLFSLRLVNKTVVAKTALDTDCEASYIRVDDHRWYAFSNTTHIQEVDKFGTSEQRTLPEDEGTGLIWRLSSITRLEERDGGVYAELEAIALSRDIPAAFRLLVTPIVRRVSKDSLATSLHQTKIAIDDNMGHRKLARAGQ
jgi:hypothetical protein